MRLSVVRYLRRQPAIGALPASSASTVANIASISLGRPGRT
jgi:hypothetical protein